MVKDQVVTSEYSIYNADSMEVLPKIPENSIDLVIYSPPFAGLYQYSSDPRDFSNCESKEQFLEQYDYMVAELARVTKPGRINAVHCTDVFDNSCRLWDLPHEIIRIHEKHGLERAPKSSDAYDGKKPYAQVGRRRFDSVFYGDA